MSRVSVRTHIARDPATVFAAVSDHERFVRLPGTVTRLVKTGSPERNGLGAVREVRVGPLRFLEEITHWDEPNAYEYRIRQSTLPLRHEGSRITVTAENGGSLVEWSGTTTSPVPVIGGILDRVLKGRLEASFTAMLDQAKAELETSPTGRAG